MGERQKVLVVEDDPANKLLIEAVLDRIGSFAVLSTDDGDAVMEAAVGGSLTAVIMDVSLKNTSVQGEKVDGVELTRRIRAVPECAHLPIILLTAHAMRGDRERLLFSSGANDYVPKPVTDPQGLVDLLRSHIRSSDELRPVRPESGGR